MGKTCLQKKIFLICSSLIVMVTPVEERIFPFEVTSNVTELSQQDPVALYLRDNRWACAGDGCLSDRAIDRFARNLRAMGSEHNEAWNQCGQPMESISGSTCRGSAILADFLSRRGSEWSALLGYNGCKGGPCESYPIKVSQHSSRFISIQSDD